MSDSPAKDRAAGRRTPDSRSRRRDAQRSRERILAAAAAVFAEHGYAGARVRDIASRAGVNAQLISYYFGGKLGLYREIGQRWRGAEAAEIPEDAPLADRVAAYVRMNREHADSARLLVWEAFNLPSDDGRPADEPESGPGGADVAGVRDRKRVGELAEDIDPDAFLLAMTAAALAPVSLPNLARQICGAEPDSAQFVERYAEQLARMVRHLGAPS